MLRETAKMVGINIHNAYITNTILCHPPHTDKTPTHAAVEACRSRLYAEILYAEPTKILLVGSTPLRALFGEEARISRMRGQGMYATIPVSYKDVEYTRWTAAWVPLKDIAYYSPDADVSSQKLWDIATTYLLPGEEQYLPIGTYKDDVVFVYNSLPLEYKEYKRGMRVKLWTPTSYTVTEPDETRSIFCIATWHPSYIMQRAPENYREFLYDMDKIWRQDAPLPDPRIDTWIPRTVEEAVEALDVISAAGILGCDTETTGLDPHVDAILSIGFGAMVEGGEYDGLAVIIPRELVYDPTVVRAVSRILSGIRAPDGQVLIFHNIKFDAQMLHASGYTMLDSDRRHAGLMDTMMMAYHHDERPSIPNEQGDASGGKAQGRSLKTLARVYYDVPDYHFDFDTFRTALEQGAVTEQEWDSLYTYHGVDCVLSARLYGDLKALLDAESEKLYQAAKNITVPACLTFAAIEYRGIRVDVPYLQELREGYQSTVDTLAGHIGVWWADSGFTEPFKASSQKVELLLGKNRIYVENTRRDSLLFFKATLPRDDERRELIDTIIAYRLNKMVLGTYIEGMLKRVDVDGRLHPTYKIDGTETTRTSAENPNLQNIPQHMGKDIRKAFIASEGMVLVNADYSQVQVRVAASALYANDATMREAYAKKEDIYRVVAGRMFSCTPAEVTKRQRSAAKSVVLGTIFERSAVGIVTGREAAMMLENGEEPWTMEEADHFITTFFQQFPGFAEYIERQHAFAWENRYVEDPLGRRRRFPLIAHRNEGHFERQTGNTPIQMGESAILLNGINALHTLFQRSQQAFIVLSVHDSITSEMYPEYVPEAARMMHNVLEHSCPFPMDIPLVVDVEVGPDWSSLVDVNEWLEKEVRYATV
jgi:DNA polymerase I-like protein with 3'-5' exonuclease and polymerase domains